MAQGPRIKVEADLSSFSAEIEKMKAQVASLGEQLRTESGKANFNFAGSKKELDGLLSQCEKLTKALDSGDKKSAQYAKNLKSMSAALADAAKVSARLESAGSSSNSNTSQYFRNYATETRTESSDVAIQRDRERTQSQVERDRQARTNRLLGGVMRIGGAVGGSVIGGGGNYANLGGLVGGMLPGPLGLVGGMVGGSIDKHMGSAKAEMVAFSELTRRIGDVNASFSGLQDAVRFSVSAFAISSEEAAKLAVNFTKLTAVGDTGLIAKAIGTSVSAAKQFGIGSDSANEFFSKSTLLGSTKNQNDFNRTMTILAESARKGGISPKMEELMSSITGMMSSSSSRSLMVGSIGSYADALATGSALPYAGLSKTPGGVASLINQFSDFTASNGGSQDVQEHRTRALMMGFPGLDPKWFSRLRQAGTMEDPAALFSPESPGYNGQDAKGRAEYDEAYGAIKRSGLTIGQAVAKYLDTLGLGAAERDAAFGSMTGAGPIKGSALEEIINSPKKWGELEAKLDSFGVSKDQQGKYAGRYAELNQGGSAGAIAYYDRLKKDNLLDKDLQKEGDKLTGSEKEKFIYNKVVPSQADDEGYQMQKSDLQLQNEISKNLGDLIGIETDARNALIELVRGLVPKSDFARKMDEKELESIKKGIPESGKNLTGSTDHPLDWEPMKKRVDDDLLKIRSASTSSSKKAAYENLMEKLHDEPGSYPAESVQWAQQAYRGEPSTAQELNPATVDNSPATQPAGPGYSGSGYAKKLGDAIKKRNPNMSDADIAAIVGNSSHETAGFKVFNDPNSGDKRGHDTRGVIGAFHWRGKRNKDFADSLNGRDPSDIDANADYFTKEFNDAYYSKTRDAMMGKSDLAGKVIAFERGFEVSGSGGDSSRISRANDFYNDQLPEGHKSTQQAQNVNMHAQAEIIVKNEQGRELGRAAPIFSTTRRPMQAGVKS